MHTEGDMKLTPRKVRVSVRDNKLTAATPALCPGYVRASLLILPAAYTDGLFHFVSWSPEACPVLEVIRRKPLSSLLIFGVNLYMDFPRCRAFLNGEVPEEVHEMKALWDIGSVGFLLGCSASFDRALFAAGLPVCNAEEHHAMPIRQTEFHTYPISPFHGPVLASMRPLPQVAVRKACQLTESMELAHGAPTQISAPEEIDIADLNKPDFGGTASIRDGETPVFWSPSVTVQAALRSAKLSLVITDVPDYPLTSDIRNDVLPELFQKEKTRV